MKMNTDSALILLVFRSQYWILFCRVFLCIQVGIGFQYLAHLEISAPNCTKNSKIEPFDLAWTFMEEFEINLCISPVRLDARLSFFRCNYNFNLLIKKHLTICYLIIYQYIVLCERSHNGILRTQEKEVTQKDRHETFNAILNNKRTIMITSCFVSL